MKTYEVWKTVPYNNKLDSYYAVVYDDKRMTAGKLIIGKDELIQTGFKTYEAGLDFINILTKLKGETR